MRTTKCCGWVLLQPQVTAKTLRMLLQSRKIKGIIHSSGANSIKKVKKGELWMAFLGEYKHTLDPKNRIFIPAKFRMELGKSFVLCKAPDDCLFIYSNENWDKVCEEIYNLPPGPKSRQIQRDLFRNAINVEPDKQGRITINQKLAEYAALKDKVTVVGAGKRIELWDEDKWIDNLTQMEQAVKDDDNHAEVHY